MSMEFQVPGLRIHVLERLSERQSEKIRLEQLLQLGEARVHIMAILEHEQRWRKAFVDQHRGTSEKHFEIGKAVLVFQTRMEQMPGKLHFRWTGLLNTSF